MGSSKARPRSSPEPPVASARSMPRRWPRRAPRRGGRPQRRGRRAVSKQIVADIGGSTSTTLDVSDPESAQAMATATLAAYGQIDYLVNNAAIYGGMQLDFLITVAVGLLQEVHEREPRRGTERDPRGLRTMKPRQCHRQPVVHRCLALRGFYGLAKVGVNGLTQQLATELGGPAFASTPSRRDRSTPRPPKSTTPGNMVKDMVANCRCRAWEPPTTWSACCCSCSPMRRAGSPVRSSMSTADRSSDHERVL